MTRRTVGYWFGYREIRCLRSHGHAGKHSGRFEGRLEWTTAEGESSKARAMSDFLSR